MAHSADPMTDTLSPDLLRRMHAWWRAANYLSVGQIYLQDNPLLEVPLTLAHVKRRLLGHWGTTPGLNLIYVHLNRLIKAHELDVLLVVGPGHGGPGIVANTYLEGSYTEHYPAIERDLSGMRRLFRQFSWPGGIPSHVAPETPGSIHEGGELGYSLAHAYGAAFDNPGLIVACVVGDGEAETGPLAASWDSNKFLNPARDGAVLPILHLNGYKIANPTVLARIGRTELFELMHGHGYEPHWVVGDDPAQVHQCLEMVLWMESDRMGYLTNTITQQAFAIQQNVVQNEKRQSYDNRPYGHSSTVMGKALFPEGHPYSWTTIGEMQDLFNATVEDVKEFHAKYYIPNNATLSIAGDFDPAEVKALVQKYFGEIPSGAEVEKLSPMPVTLAETKKLYHEDNFANTSQYTMAFPTAEMYHEDAYALSALAEILAGGKKSPMYNVLVKEKKLTSNVGAYNMAQVLAGTFRISVNANPGVSLAEIEKAIFEAFGRFESEGVTEKDLERVKAGQETRFYNMISSVDGKSKQLAEYNMYAGDPAYYKRDMEAMKAVTVDDVRRVYEKYIKEKNFVATSFVPRGKVDLAAEGSVNAGIVEENILTATEVKIEAGAAEEIRKTPTSFDRSVQPPLGPDVSVTVPPVWKSSLANGMRLYGIQHMEVPLVQYNIVIEGGHMLDAISAPGVASMLASMLNEGTKNKTPEELEEEIDLLGAMIRVSADVEDITVSVNTLSRNFEKTLVLVEEMLLQPRWDSLAFELAKTRTINGLKRSSIDPTYLGSRALNRLVLGEDNIYATDVAGTVESVQAMTMDQLREFYEKNISPSVARFLIVGAIDQPAVEKALVSLNANWAAKEVQMPQVTFAPAPEKPAVYFVNIPDAKQSNIFIGGPSIPRGHPDYYPAYVANYKLGGSFNGFVNLVLREEKGYTYGARTGINAMKNYGAFVASSAVRSTATLESVEIFRDLMSRYREGVAQEDVDFTKNALLKGNALRFETQRALMGMLNTMSAYNLPDDFIAREENYVKHLTVDDVNAMVKRYIDPLKMYYVVAGDAATQLRGLKKLGFGEPVLLN